MDSFVRKKMASKDSVATYNVRDSTHLKKRYSFATDNLTVLLRIVAQAYNGVLICLYTAIEGALF